jgi:hypothetical protein
MKTLRKEIFLAILFLLNLSNVFPDSTEDFITKNTKISKTDIRIGERINLIVKIPNLETAKVLWQEMTYSDSSADILTKKEYYKDKLFCIDIDFSFFDPGTYRDFIFTVPISVKGGDVLYLTTNKYTINVKSPLSNEEIENIKNIKDPSKIELRKEKEQAKFNFSFLPYLKIIVIILILLLIGTVIYFLLYRHFRKLKGTDVSERKLPPYEQFLLDISRVQFNLDDDRLEIENKLSDLTEILKELIYREYSLNAPSETTRELVSSLKEINFNDEILLEISRLFREIDMIKFARSDYEFDRMFFYLTSVKSLGEKINNIYKTQTVEKEKKEKTNADIQT